MFAIIEKEPHEHSSHGERYRKAYDVYDVRDSESTYPQFLIYNDGKWEYVNAVNYKPLYSECGDS